MTSTQTTRHIRASRSAIYRALTDGDAIAKWRVPPDMDSVVHEFDAREGGAFRISLTYASPEREGKSGGHTDTYHGRFVRLVPGERVVEAFSFETDDPGMQGEVTMTTTLVDRDGGTEVSVTFGGLPPNMSTELNEMGTRMALDHLAALVEDR